MGPCFNSGCTAPSSKFGAVEVAGITVTVNDAEAGADHRRTERCMVNGATQVTDSLLHERLALQVVPAAGNRAEGPTNPGFEVHAVASFHARFV